MKRHPGLAPLSRDHHHALVIARRLRQADESNAEETAHADHVKLEEQELFPLIERTIPDPELSALADRLGDAARPRTTDPAGNTPAHDRRAGNTPAHD